MTSPVTEISVKCPKCGKQFTAWYRASINLSLGEEWTKERIEAATTAACPDCEFRVEFDSLIVDENGVFHLND